VSDSLIHQFKAAEDRRVLAWVMPGTTRLELTIQTPARNYIAELPEESAIQAARLPLHDVPAGGELMSWRLDDGGRADAGFKGSTGDCVTRAIAIATERPYAEVYGEIARRNRDYYATTRSRNKAKRTGTLRSATPREGAFKEAYAPYLIELGWTWTPTMSIGSGTTVHLRPSELPKGRLIARCSRHLVAVIDGVAYDITDPTRDGTRAVYGYWSPAKWVPVAREPIDVEALNAQFTVVDGRLSVCCRRWHASRIEVETAPVLHVCDLPEGHPNECRCPCGASHQSDRED
jgi:hypothetical protein